MIRFVIRTNKMGVYWDRWWDFLYRQLIQRIQNLPFFFHTKYLGFIESFSVLGPITTLTVNLVLQTKVHVREISMQLKRHLIDRQIKIYITYSLKTRSMKDDVLFDRVSNHRILFLRRIKNIDPPTGLSGDSLLQLTPRL